MMPQTAAPGMTIFGSIVDDLQFRQDDPIATWKWESPPWTMHLLRTRLVSSTVRYDIFSSLVRYGTVRYGTAQYCPSVSTIRLYINSSTSRMESKKSLTAPTGATNEMP